MYNESGTNYLYIIMMMIQFRRKYHDDDNTMSKDISIHGDGNTVTKDIS